MGFFIDTSTGQVALERQLQAAGISSRETRPPRPWLALQGPRDASTLWYAVMRKETRGVFIGALCFRHTDRQALLERQGWVEVPVEEVGAGVDPDRPPASPSPFDASPTPARD